MPVTPNLGRFGTFGVGPQTVAGTAVDPTQFLRYNGGTPLTPSITRARDNYANGSLHQQAERVQGRTYQGKNVTFEVEHAGLLMLLQLMLVAAPAAGIITPAVQNFAANMPLTPATIEANIPGNPTRVVDAQFNNLAITMNARANFTATAGFMAVGASDMADPAAAVLPSANIYQYKNHFMVYSGGNLSPESSSLTLDIPMAPIDAARGNLPADADYIQGFERNGPMALSGSFSVPGVPPALLAAHRDGQFATLEWTLRKYAADGTTLTREIAFVIPNAEINTFEPPLTLDRIVTPVNWSAVSLAGEPAFTVRVL